MSGPTTIHVLTFYHCRDENTANDSKVERIQDPIAFSDREKAVRYIYTMVKDRFQAHWNWEDCRTFYERFDPIFDETGQLKCEENLMKDFANYLYGGTHVKQTFWWKLDSMVLDEEPPLEIDVPVRMKRMRY